MAPAPGTVGHATPIMAMLYALLNIFSSCSIVFANKTVFTVYRFEFVVTLTLIHTIFTWVGMSVMAKLRFFRAKPLPQLSLLPLAIGYVGYICLGNVSLSLNTVGFYQIMKIATTPIVIVLEYMFYGTTQTLGIILSIAVICIGVVGATVSDRVAVSNMSGVIVACLATIMTSLFQIWAGSKQRELTANSSQLLLAYTPQAAALLALLVPFFDPIGLGNPAPGTLLGFEYSIPSVVAIVVSALLGILVSLSTFLIIGATSPVTYNIIGHLKSMIIVAGGAFIFRESMPWKKVLCILVTIGGMIWYTALSVQQMPSSGASPSVGALTSQQKAKAGAEDSSLLPGLRLGGHLQDKGDEEDSAELWADGGGRGGKGLTDQEVLLLPLEAPTIKTPRVGPMARTDSSPKR